MRPFIRNVMIFGMFFSTAITGSCGDFRFFGDWKGIPTQDEREWVYMGFVNGFFAGNRSFAYHDLGKCIDKNISAEQAVAMIDKYSTDNPQRWNATLPTGIIESLTVKDGPCPNLNPFK